MIIESTPMTSNAAARPNQNIDSSPFAVTARKMNSAMPRMISTQNKPYEHPTDDIGKHQGQKPENNPDNTSYKA